MGWPITHIPGADSFAYVSQDAGIWQFVDPAEGVKVTLKSFRFSVPSVDGNLDLVGPHQIGPSGKPDFVGQFVLEVEPYTPGPSDLLVWLQAVAGDDGRRAQHGRAVEGTTRLGERRPSPSPLPTAASRPGKSSRDVGARASQKQLDEDRTAHTTCSTPIPRPASQVRWQGVEYPRFKTVEWTLHFKNTGSSDTPILADIQALDTQFSATKAAASFAALQPWRHVLAGQLRTADQAARSQRSISLLRQAADDRRTARFPISISAQARRE